MRSNWFLSPVFPINRLITGLPEPLVFEMARFADDCRENEVFWSGIWMGPDIGDLQLRFGVHSVPINASVLRSENEKARGLPAIR